ncbi:MAG: hypothetical protein WC712_01700 [Candidatus Brocadiia bacterium]
MRYSKMAVLALMLVISSTAIAMADYLERIDGGGVIGDVEIASDKVSVVDWDGKRFKYFRDFVRRIRSQETGKFEDYRSKTFFDIHTDAGAKFAGELGSDLDTFYEFLVKTFGFEKPPKDRIMVRVFSSTRDYEEHWDSRHGQQANLKKQLAFFDVNYKDVSAPYSGRDTFTNIAPRVAYIFLLRKYPNMFKTPQYWLELGWFNIFSSTRVENGQVDMVGLGVDAMDDLQKYLEDKPFSVDSLFSFKVEPGKTTKEEYDTEVLMAGAFFHYLYVNSKKYGKNLDLFFSDLNNYDEPAVAFQKRIEKKPEVFQDKLREWAKAYSEESPWRLYLKAERYFINNNNTKALDSMEEGITKYPSFTNFRRLRAMTLIRMGSGDEAEKDIAELDKDPINAEMCLYMRGLLAYKAGELAKASGIFVSLSEKDKGFYRCYEQLLNIYWDQETQIVTDAQADSYVVIMKENEPYSFTFILEAKVLMKQGKPEEAKVPLQKAQRRDPENKEIEKLDRIRRKQAQEKAAGK